MAFGETALGEMGLDEMVIHPARHFHIKDCSPHRAFSVYYAGWL
jgi:hypothetical protein